MATTLGRCAFVSYEELDAAVCEWGEKTLGQTAGAHVFGGTETDPYIWISFCASPEISEKVQDVIRKYDAEGEMDTSDFTAEVCFEGMTHPCAFPALMSLRILGDIFRRELLFCPRSVVPTPGGAIFVEKPVGEDFVSDCSRNTRINYLYRDGSNYKFWQSAIVRGEITKEQIFEIMGCLEDFEYFNPPQVGLPCDYAEPYAPNEDDHPFCELFENSFSVTDDDPDWDLSACELVEKFKAAKGNWSYEFLN